MFSFLRLNPPIAPFRKRGGRDGGGEKERPRALFFLFSAVNLIYIFIYYRASMLLGKIRFSINISLCPEMALRMRAFHRFCAPSIYVSRFLRKYFIFVCCLKYILYITGSRRLFCLVFVVNTLRNASSANRSIYGCL